MEQPHRAARIGDRLLDEYDVVVVAEFANRAIRGGIGQWIEQQQRYHRLRDELEQVRFGAEYVDALPLAVDADFSHEMVDGLARYMPICPLAITHGNNILHRDSLLSGSNAYFQI